MNSGTVQGKKKGNRRKNQVKLDIQGEYDDLGCLEICKEFLNAPHYLETNSVSEQSTNFTRSVFGRNGQDWGLQPPTNTFSNKNKAENEIQTNKDQAGFSRFSFGSATQVNSNSDAPNNCEKSVLHGRFHDETCEKIEFERSTFGIKMQSSDNSATFNNFNFSRQSFGREEQKDPHTDKLNNDPVDATLARENFGKMKQDFHNSGENCRQEISREAFGMQSQSLSGTQAPTRSAFAQNKQSKDSYRFNIQRNHFFTESVPPVGSMHGSFNDTRSAFFGKSIMKSKLQSSKDEVSDANPQAKNDTTGIE